MDVKRALVFVPLVGCCPKVSYFDVDANFVVAVDGGADDMAAQCAQLCIAHQHFQGMQITSCQLDPVDAGLLDVSCAFTAPAPCVGGRRPGEWVRVDNRAREVVGAWLAQAAQLEAASVPAFEILADELRAHDAPKPLIAAALASADDERRHAAIMTASALRFDAVPGPVRVPRRAPRDLEAIARENAVEGLVREAFGARVTIDRDIAADELRHAALAAAVHDWIRPNLPYAARRRVDEARDAARAQLLVDAAVEPPRPLRDLLGLPEATHAVDIARHV